MIEYTHDRHQVACLRYGFCGLGIPEGDDATRAFQAIQQQGLCFQSEAWSSCRFTPIADDTAPCWWITNKPFGEAQVHISKASIEEANGTYPCVGVMGSLSPLYRKGSGASTLYIYLLDCMTWSLVSVKANNVKILYTKKRKQIGFAADADQKWAGQVPEGECVNPDGRGNCWSQLAAGAWTFESWWPVVARARQHLLANLSV